MLDLSKIPLILAEDGNYSKSPRMENTIKYIVMHYTGNINDTAYNNVRYFRENLTKSSAHFFVSENTIYQSVPITNAAYSVGLGSMTKPYIPNPTFYKLCTNSNSVSVEMCGSAKSREASAKTKQTACKLVVALLKRLNLKPDCVIRHYDVTGKQCPAWAVEDPAKWLELLLEINKLFNGDDEMTNSEENYAVFKEFMSRYTDEQGQLPATWETDAMEFAKANGLINDGKPKANITRGEIATVIQRLTALLKS